MLHDNWQGVGQQQKESAVAVSNQPRQHLLLSRSAFSDLFLEHEHTITHSTSCSLPLSQSVRLASWRSVIHLAMVHGARPLLDWLPATCALPPFAPHWLCKTLSEAFDCSGAPQHDVSRPDGPRVVSVKSKRAADQLDDYLFNQSVPFPRRPHPA